MALKAADSDFVAGSASCPDVGIPDNFDDWLPNPETPTQEDDSAAQTPTAASSDTAQIRHCDDYVEHPEASIPSREFMSGAPGWSRTGRGAESEMLSDHRGCT